MEVVLYLGEAERAARLLAAVEPLWEAGRFHPDQANRWLLERAAALVRARLDPYAFAASWEAGRSLSLEAAVADLLAAARQSGLKNS